MAEKSPSKLSTVVMWAFNETGTVNVISPTVMKIEPVPTVGLAVNRPLWSMVPIPSLTDQLNSSSWQSRGRLR